MKEEGLRRPVGENWFLPRACEAAARVCVCVRAVLVIGDGSRARRTAENETTEQRRKDLEEKIIQKNK